MQARCVIILFAALSIGVSGCDKPVDPKVKSFIYPLAMGNQWVYDYQTITDYRGKKPNDTLTFSIAATVVGVDTILPGIYSYTVDATSTLPEWPTPPPENRYVNLPDGMYLQSSEIGAGLELPKQHAGGPAVMFRGRQFRGIQSLIASLVGPFDMASGGRSAWYDPLPLILPYPQHLGQRWACSPPGDDQTLRLDKQITGRETAKNSVGSFDCLLIHWIYDPPLEDIDLVDFISAEGLIRRRVEVRNLIMTDYEHPYGGDTADVISTYELTSLQLH